MKKRARKARFGGIRAEVAGGAFAMLPRARASGEGARGKEWEGEDGSAWLCPLQPEARGREEGRGGAGASSACGSSRERGREQGRAVGEMGDEANA